MNKKTLAKTQTTKQKTTNLHFLFFINTMATEKRKIAIGSDHAAWEAKNAVIAFLEERGKEEVINCGTNGPESVDYPDFANKVCQMVVNKEVDCGILLCGSGIGISIAANKVNGIRAALCHDHYTALMCREHNDANVLCMGARVSGGEIIKEMVVTYLETPFEGGKHAKRVAKIHALE